MAIHEVVVVVVAVVVVVVVLKTEKKVNKVKTMFAKDNNTNKNDIV